MQTPRLITASSGFVAGLLAVFAPPSCALCRRPLPGDGGGICRRCESGLPWLPGGCCPRCALPDHRWSSCPARGASLAGAWAACAYDGLGRTIVKTLKFRPALTLATVMANQMAARIADSYLREPVAVVPVPAQPSRFADRGFNVAAELARPFARAVNRRYHDCLRRHDRGAPQVGKDALHRREPSAAELMRVECIGPSPPRVLLIDDVHTTGATLNQSANALIAAGADSVLGVTYARTL